MVNCPPSLEYRRKIPGPISIIEDGCLKAYIKYEYIATWGRVLRNGSHIKQPIKRSIVYNRADIIILSAWTFEWTWTQPLLGRVKISHNSIHFYHFNHTVISYVTHKIIWKCSIKKMKTDEFSGCRRPHRRGVEVPARPRYGVVGISSAAIVFYLAMLLLEI